MNAFGEDLHFCKVRIRQFTKRGQGESKDGNYWKKFRTRSTNQTGAISWLDFCPTGPHKLAATSGTRVAVYDEVSAHDDKTLQLSEAHAYSKFQDLAHCGNFRNDGRLLTAGSEEGAVKVFNCTDRSLLRTFNGHKRAVRLSLFCSGKLHILSGSDDTTVRFWDLSEGKQLSRFDGHRDYIRAGSQSPTSVNIWATGGYDHVCRLWDVRSQTNVVDLDHGAPIESITFLPSGHGEGTLLVTAGGSYLCVWDVLNTGQTLRKIEKHHKTITTVRSIQNTSQDGGPRLCSVSLDQHLKIYDLDEFGVIHDSRYKHPILSFAGSPDGTAYAVGMANGSIVYRDCKHKSETHEEVKGEGHQLDTSIEEQRVPVKGFQKHMQKFRYKDALDIALKGLDPKVVPSLLEELAARDGVIAALSGRSVEELVPVLKYIAMNISEPTLVEILLPFLQIILDLYDKEYVAETLTQELDAILRRLQAEVSFLIEMKELKGCIEAVLCTKWQSTL